MSVIKNVRQALSVGERGSSMMEVVVAMSLTVTVLLASVTIVNHAVAQVGSVQTDLPEKPARLKTVGFQWVQSQIEVMRSLGFAGLSALVLQPAQSVPIYSTNNATGESYRDITSGTLATGEQPLPRGYARARVTVGVESLDGCPSSCQLGLIAVKVELFARSADTTPSITAETSVVRR